MNATPCLLHAAVHCDTQEHAQQFFSKILGLKLVKSFSLDTTLSSKIFAISTPVDIQVFGNECMQIEVFIHPLNNVPLFTHLCLQVEDITIFIKGCKNHGLTPYQVQKGEKQLLFVRDFTGNLYEIKELKK
jgi:extradiol dioxygenase family protein